MILKKQNIEVTGLTVLLALCLACLPAFAQTGSVKVRVSDEVGPLVGAGVIVKGTDNGAVTDNDGVANLTRVPQDGILEVSMIGYTTQEIEVGSRSLIEVLLSESSVILDEVVFIGYGTAKKKDLTGSVIRADLETFKQTPNTGIMESLHGTVAGLNIGQTNQAGANPSIEVRGQTTINGNTNPLIVLDGIIYTGRINDLNPADIASIDVLKDASSKAVYGAQAANGVLIITSKGGRRDVAPKITYNGTFGFSEPTVNTHFLGRDEWLKRMRDIEYEKAYTKESGYTQENPEWDYTMAQIFAPTIAGIKNGTEFDWWDECTNMGHVFKHNVTVAGGSKTASYYISGSHSDIKGITMNDTYKRNTLRVNMDVNVTDWLKIGTNTFLAFLDFSGESPEISDLIVMNPVVTPYEEDGSFAHNPSGQVTLNPFLFTKSDDLEKKHQISTALYGIIDFPWITGLQYRLNYSYRLNAANNGNFNEYKSNFQGQGQKTYADDNYWLLDNILSYNRTFGQHNLGVTLVYGVNRQQHDETVAKGVGFSNTTLSYNALEFAETQTISSAAYSQSNLYQMARLTYGYAQKYLFTATVRRDGFSGFAENYKFGIFPSAGLAWVISQENFMKNSPWINNLKVRVSYGSTGNQVARYSSLAQVSSSQNYVFGDGAGTSIGTNVSTMANKSLKWETTNEFNVGLDFGFFKNRLEGSVDYYNSMTRDLLWPMSLPSTTGFTQVTTNLGNIRNNGVEIMLTGIPVLTKDFEWSISTAFSANNNRIVSLLGKDDDGDGKEDDLITSGLFIGQPIGTIYDYQVDGIWQLNDNIPSGWYPGTYKLHDFGNGEAYDITAAEDRIILGHTEPAFRLGITNRFRYRNLSLSFLVNIINGGKDGYMGANGGRNYSTAGNAQNQNAFTFNDFWSPRNPDGIFAVTWVTPKVPGQLYQQRNFVRLQDLSLSYRLGKRMVKKIGAEDLALSFAGKNLLTFTKWVGWDPEMGLGASAASRPVMRSYSLGIDLTF
ncbi:MAG: SusC/RagA family TonB-linked outer membrane protein [Bacteroidales bacterium]|nr:SusC/RagA family TonB-linked outer membrane protein [Bacteroidales bacterium]